MAQNTLLDPSVSAGPTLTGTGNGTLAVDRLTHFTVGQIYTATCIAKTPDTVFNISGSVDGSVGIAVVGTQFFDQDLKVFLTIQQGSTVFEVGDQFTFTVVNGTDLNQDNIDTYDELIQKNFGEGTRGSLSGDHNLRYDDDDQFASLTLGDLKFTAITAGLTGNDIQIAYLAPVAPVAATLVRQDLTFSAKTAGTGGNAITIEYLDMTAAVKAEVTIQDIRYRAQTGGVGGNSITVAYTTGGTAGSEGISVLGNAVTIQIQSGVSTATQVQAAVIGNPAAFALLDPFITGTASNAQTAPVAPTSLAGGVDAIGNAGFEFVQVSGNAITIQLENVTSTATQVKAAIDAYPAASALVSVAITGTASAGQSTPVAAANLTGGVAGNGNFGSESVSVVSNLINVYMETGMTTASTIASLIAGSVPASALVSASVVGYTGNPQNGPVSATNLTGGKNKTYAFNHNEITDAGSFAEGNASVHAKDLTVDGKSTFAETVTMSKPLVLNDSASGRAISNAQQTMNRLRSLGRLTIKTSDNSKVFWQSGVLTVSSDLLVAYRDSSVVNTLAAGSFALSDGQSLFLLLKPDATESISSSLATSSDVLTAFRLGTRIGSNFIWFNNVVQRDTDYVRLGGVVDFREQLFTTISGGGFITHDISTPGLITWPSDIKIRPMGSSAVLTVGASNTTLTDGQMGYVSLADPIVTAAVTINSAALTAANMARTDRFWLFYRSGNTIFFRNGTSVEQGESAHIQCVGSSSANIANSIVRRDASGDFSARNATLNKAIVAPGTGNGIDVSAAGDMEVGASVGANDLILGGSSSNVVIPGNLEVLGTTTTLNTQTLDVEDTNITVNNGGTDMTSEGAGLTVDRTGVSGSLIYAAAAASRWKAGDLGSEIELADISSIQSFSNKTFISNLILDSISTWNQQNNAVATGTNATATTPTKMVVRLTNGALTSLDGITAPATAQVFTLVNSTGNSITINNDTGTAANRILTGTGLNLTFTADATLILIYDLTTTKWRVIGGSGSGGVTTMAAVGASPNANGATISSNTLTLQPANATNPGVLTAGAQNIGGQKTFKGGAAIESSLNFTIAADSTAGSNASLPDAGAVLTTLVSGSLVSVGNIASPNTGKVRIITNNTGASITLLNNSTGTAAHRVITGTGSDVIWGNNVSLFFYYDDTSNTRWMLIGSAGTSGPTILGTRGSPRIIVAAVGITSGAGHMSTIASQQDIYVAGSVVGDSIIQTITSGTVDGQRMTIIGRDSTQTVTINNTTSNVSLNGPCTLGAGDVLNLRWDTDDWQETSRS